MEYIYQCMKYLCIFIYNYVDFCKIYQKLQFDDDIITIL